MRVLIDTSPLYNANAVRGVGRYTSQLIEALSKLTDNKHEFVTTKDQHGKYDLIHYPFFDLFFPTLPIIRAAKTVVTIHDVTPLVLAKHYPRGIRGEFALFRQKVALRNVDAVITDSNCSKRDIIDYLKVPPDRITVVPLAASQDFNKPPQSSIEVVRKKYQIPKNYILYVGDISYNKNLPFLIQVAGRIPDLTLVLVGKEVGNISIPEGKAIESAIQTTGNAKYVRLVDNVESVADLASIYAGASCYIQPSLYEGFGLPIIEAMRCKTPVVSSCGGSLAQLVGNFGIQYNPTDNRECEQAIRKVLRMTSEDRQKMVRRAYQYSDQFTWERTAKETLAVYEKII